MCRSEVSEDAATLVELNSQNLDGRWWIGLVGGGIVWMLHFLTAAVVAEWGCTAGLQRWQPLGITAIAWAIIAATLLAAGVGLWVVWVAKQVLTHTRIPSDRNTNNDVYDRHGNRRLLAKTGWFASLFFLFVTIVQSIPILFYLTGC